MNSESEVINNLKILLNKYSKQINIISKKQVLMKDTIMKYKTILDEYNILYNRTADLPLVRNKLIRLIAGAKKKLLRKSKFNHHNICITTKIKKDLKKLKVANELSI